MGRDDGCAVTLCNAFEPRAMFSVTLPGKWLAKRRVADLITLFQERFAKKHGVPLEGPLALEVDGAACADDEAALAEEVEDGDVVTIARHEAKRTRRARLLSVGRVLASRERHEEALVAFKLALEGEAGGSEGDAAVHLERGACFEALGRTLEARGAYVNGGADARRGRAKAP